MPRTCANERHISTRQDPVRTAKLIFTYNTTIDGHSSETFLRFEATMSITPSAKLIMPAERRRRARSQTEGKGAPESASAITE